MEYEDKERQNQPFSVISLPRFSLLKMGNGLETERIPKFAGNRIFPTRQRKTTEDNLF
jgi:hypothetical protein